MLWLRYLCSTSLTDCRKESPVTRFVKYFVVADVLELMVCSIHLLLPRQNGPLERAEITCFKFQDFPSDCVYCYRVHAIHMIWKSTAGAFLCEVIRLKIAMLSLLIYNCLSQKLSGSRLDTIRHTLKKHTQKKNEVATSTVPKIPAKLMPSILSCFTCQLVFTETIN